MPWGLSPEEWKRLIELQRELNIRNSKIIEIMESQISNNFKIDVPLKEKE